ncbi:PIN domain-containing protein [Bisgaard Taxon 45]|uniref:PIN domain-containing protein n=1 Tax=Bisgaard Taxon 45 TaxID=304289 RepID=A0ABT9KDF2_9PAST|nr:PIN domain-containing protein [Bisgaard Taxon 45]
MKYAFIDYENIHSLDNINLNEYEKIYLFLGAQQQSITLSEKFNDQIVIHLITIKDVAKNNLDFHLAYFLGKFDQEVDKNIHFDVISKDKGYQGVCDYIQNQKSARNCQLLTFDKRTVDKQLELVKEEEITLQQNAQKYAELYKDAVKNISTKNLPSKLETLSNHIRSQTDLKHQDPDFSAVIIDKVIAKLKEETFIKINNNSIVYTQVESHFEIYRSYLLKKQKNKRPTKLSSLKNDIASKLNLQKMNEVDKIIALLRANNIILNTQEEKVQYK